MNTERSLDHSCTTSPQITPLVQHLLETWVQVLQEQQSNIHCDEGGRWGGRAVDSHT